MQIVRKFFRLAHTDKYLLFEAVLTSFAVKLVITLLPMRWYARYLGVQHAVVPENDREGDKHMIFKISQAIVRCRKAIIWHNRCLVEAITAKRMLKIRGLNSTLYLGVNKENNKMIAHAWLRCGSIIVSGKQGMQKFVVVSTFT
jgi:hypothetical protein